MLVVDETHNETGLVMISGDAVPVSVADRLIFLLRVDP
jgi:hypothetical protein